MICIICSHAETVEGSTLVSFARGEFRLLVNRVPARICPSCGEAFVDEVIAKQVLQIAKQTYECGVLDTQCEYSTLQI
jgi:YgiT-type zinc finger domain-containing protein